MYSVLFILKLSDLCMYSYACLLLFHFSEYFENNKNTRRHFYIRVGLYYVGQYHDIVIDNKSFKNVAKLKCFGSVLTYQIRWCNIIVLNVHAPSKEKSDN